MNEISIDDLAGDTRAQAQAQLDAGRSAYYLAYDQNFSFQATVGETYYMAMDLQTAAGCLGGSGLASYALSDFSNTITYQFGGAGLNLTTGVIVSGNEIITSDDFFGGSSSSVTMSGGTLTWNGDFRLGAGLDLEAGSTNTFDTAGFAGTLGQGISAAGPSERSAPAPL